MNKKLSFAVLASIVMLLAACGGSNDNRHDEQDVTVPESANQGTEGFVAYLTRLVQSSADLLEPVDIGGLSTSTPEQEEPAPV